MKVIIIIIKRKKSKYQNQEAKTRFAPLMNWIMIRTFAISATVAVSTSLCDVRSAASYIFTTDIEYALSCSVSGAVGGMPCGGRAGTVQMPRTFSQSLWSDSSLYEASLSDLRSGALRRNMR